VTANNTQIGGTHYKSMALEHWDIVAIDALDYFQGCITKYVMRWRGKNGLQDLEKAKHYLDKYIEIETLRLQGRLTIKLLMAAIHKLDLLDKQMEEEQRQKDKSASNVVPIVADENPARRVCPACLVPLPQHTIGCVLADGDKAACTLCGGLVNHLPTCPSR
jgi:hypothetical protein